jgi:anaerobic selenocysteine-containing dehydrogenase
MNQTLRPRILASACPHDCPSTCALEVEVFGDNAIGRVRGAEDNAYTAGVICAKVARYAERVHHPDRLKHPLRRTGPKGSGQFAQISWDEALDLVAEQFVRAEQAHGSEAIWPYFYAGTMGYVMRDGIHRLRHAKKYSGFFTTICVNPAWTGFRRHRPARRRRSARDGEVRPGGDLGHQCGEYPGQCDDARDARP